MSKVYNRADPDPDPVNLEEEITMDGPTAARARYLAGEIEAAEFESLLTDERIWVLPAHYRKYMAP